MASKRESIFIVVSLCLLVTVLLVMPRSKLRQKETVKVSAGEAQPIRVTANLKLPARVGHEVVPGGIHDFDAAMKAYPNLNRANLSVGTLPEDVYAYVSYRGDDGQIHWTAKKRLIPKGTAIITDGVIYILQRCGNQIQFDAPPPDSTETVCPADVFPPVSAPIDPTPNHIALPPEIPNGPLPEPLAFTPTSPTPPAVPFIPTSSIAIPPTLVPICCSVPVVNTPEPETWEMLGVGLFVILIWLSIMSAVEKRKGK